ncbi:MAG: cytochrome ubiquinol oxidase subunit I, partial [Planctomycetota bacterium]|nr:cytochrome ubiquinol oxidase subunit I [Planctomycetota bacterium]
MSDLLAARWLMAISLAFHILFAVAGMAMPLFLMLAEILRLRTGDPMWKELAFRWARGTAVLFAVGAVSGTVLSFELGLLWPGFTSVAGPAIGIPFTLEGFAFFFEAIFLGIYLYGRERISPGMRVFSAGAIALSGLASGVFVMAVNAWMQSPPPSGGAVDPWTAFKSPAYPHQAVHMALSAYLAVAFLAAGVHAWALLRRPKSDFHGKALTLVLAIGIPLAPLQIVSGDLSARFVAHDQPVKFAAMEALHETQARAPIRLGPIEVPGVLSWLAHGDVDAEVM